MQFRVNTLVSALSISLTYPFHTFTVRSWPSDMSYFIVSQVTACSPQFNVNNWMQRAEENHPTEEVSHCHSKYQNKEEPPSKKRSYTMTLQVSKLIWEPPSDSCEFHEHPTGKYTIHCPKRDYLHNDSLERDTFALQQQSHPPDKTIALQFWPHKQEPSF